VTAALPARKPRLDLAFERWSYGQSYTTKRIDGVRAGFADGYRDGFDTGVEVGAARILLAVEHGLGGRPPALLPRLPHVGCYLAYRRRTRPSNEPRAEECGFCSQCIRAAAVQANLARYGMADYPGALRSDGGSA
jgi:hypothetical protein